MEFKLNLSNLNKQDNVNTNKEEVNTITKGGLKKLNFDLLKKNNNNDNENTENNEKGLKKLNFQNIDFKEESEKKRSNDMILNKLKIIDIHDIEDNDEISKKRSVEINTNSNALRNDNTEDREVIN